MTHKQEAGPKRWGPPRTVRLADLDPVTREIILAILRGRDNAAKASPPRTDPPEDDTPSD